VTSSERCGQAAGCKAVNTPTVLLGRRARNSAQEPTDPRRNLLWEDRPMRGEGSAAQRQGRSTAECQSWVASRGHIK
jgi:hypothetical protein